jgi:hypothetical protein
MTLLMVLSVVGVAALFIALAIFLVLICNELEVIGGPATRFKKPVNFLSKIRLGVRAIEVQTGHLVPEVTKLNAGLGAVRDGLGIIASNLSGVIASVSRQKP